MAKTRKQRKQRKQRGKGQTCSRGICRTTPESVVVPGARNSVSFENPMRRAPDTIESLTLQNESLTQQNLKLDLEIMEIQGKLDKRQAELLTVPRTNTNKRSFIQKFINMYRKEIRTKQNMARTNERLIGINEAKIQRMRQAAYNRNHPEEAAARQEAANAAALAAFMEENPTA
jgi:sugar-specific transcriptional regulator TrmB